MRYYSTVKIKGIMKFACKWVELEIMILSEVTQIQMEKYSMFFLICVYDGFNRKDPPKAHRFEPLSRIGLIPRSHWSIPSESHGFYCKVLIFVLDGVFV